MSRTSHAGEPIMITFWSTPFWAIFLAIVVILSSHFALRYQKRSLVYSMLVSAAWSALGWVLFDTFFVHGVSAFAGIIWADAFLGYLPLSYVSGLLTRVLFRRKLYLRFGSIGLDRP